MSKEITALEAKYEAHKIVFGPLYFQAVVAMKRLGVLETIAKHRSGITAEELSKITGVSLYGIKILTEAAEIDVIEQNEGNKFKITKIGFFLLKDEMTNVNLNFMKDVCYQGADFMTESIVNGKPEGLKVLGEWSTLYEGLATFPEPARTSWLNFDHYYSDGAFPNALEIVFSTKPKLLFDIGGNTGKWSMACCGYDADVKVKILDLPGQLASARKNVEAQGLSDRIDFHQIDLLDTSQRIPKGADVIWMSQFLDCFSEEEILGILDNARNASDENTIIYIMEPFIDNQKYPAAAYSLVATSLYFTIMANGNSKMYTVDAMKNLIKQAGLEIVEVFPLIGDSYHTIIKCRKQS
jgi:hypothetical protein